jgi:glycosyltransferase involved in cell wall biosynthesis
MRPDATRTLTVVIPVWDRYAGTTLRDALASIRAQRLRPSVLVLDNASAAPIAVPDDVRVIRTEERLTIGAARNHALAHVTTPWVMLWDADDVMLPDTIADLLTRAERDPGAVVIATGILDGSTGYRHHWPRTWTRPLSRLPRAYATLHAISSLFPTTGALLRTRDVLEGGGFADADGGDDWVAGVSLALRGRIVVSPRLGRLYRHHDDSVSAGWAGRSDIREHARLVRARLREDAATPRALRAALGPLALLQAIVIMVLRPLSRLTPRRQRELRPVPPLEAWTPRAANGSAAPAAARAATVTAAREDR